MRAPFQVLVIPFRRTARGVQFAILNRSDANYWQFIAGGGKHSETPFQAAQRETEEEVGMPSDVVLMKLDSMATVPKDCFAAAESWGDHVYVIPEHCFAVEIGNSELKLSAEHTDFQWLEYEEAMQKLKWDSNRNALWELNERLKKEDSSKQDAQRRCHRRTAQS